MEVHHHPHLEGKKWTHYLWEFIMLFLAVFCGFLAEYQLEHKIEKERVKKYMHDMVENLKYDTTRISINGSTNRDTHKDLDSFRLELKEVIEGRANTSRLYYYFFKIRDFGIAAFNKSAITQLKNSGSLRLVKNDSLLNEMLDYYERKVLACEYYQAEVQKAIETMNANSIRVFSTTPFRLLLNNADSTWSNTLLNADYDSIATVLNYQSLKLLTNDPKELEILNTNVYRLEYLLLYYNRFLNFARHSADKLMVRIREIYY